MHLNIVHTLVCKTVTQVDVSSNDVALSPAKTAYMATFSTLQKMNNSHMNKKIVNKYINVNK